MMLNPVLEGCIVAWTRPRIAVESELVEISQGFNIGHIVRGYKIKRIVV